MEGEPKKIVKVSGSEQLTVARRRNELIIAKHRLSLQAQRLFLYTLSMVSDDHDENTEYEFAVNELASAIGIDRSKLYKSVVSVLGELAGTMMTVQALDENGKAIPNRFVRIGLIKNRQEVRMTDKGSNRLVGSISVSMYKELLPYVRELKERYTEVELKHVFSLPSSYSLRLYDLLKLRAFTKRAWSVKRAELRELMGVGKDEYELWGDFRRTILEKAQTDICNLTDLAFDIEYVQAGRAVVEIIFRFRNKDGAVLMPAGGARDTVYKSLLDLGLLAETAEGIMKTWWDVDAERVRWHVAEAKRMKNIGKVTNAVGWFLSGIKKDYRPRKVVITEMRKHAGDKREEYKKEGGLILGRKDLQEALGDLYNDVGRASEPIGSNGRGDTRGAQTTLD